MLLEYTVPLVWVFVVACPQGALKLRVGAASPISRWCGGTDPLLSCVFLPSDAPFVQALSKTAFGSHFQPKWSAGVPAALHPLPVIVSTCPCVV